MLEWLKIIGQVFAFVLDWVAKKAKAAADRLKQKEGEGKDQGSFPGRVDQGNQNGSADKDRSSIDNSLNPKK